MKGKRIKKSFGKKCFLWKMAAVCFCLSFAAGKGKAVSAEEYICPESSSEYLSDDEIQSLTLQELNYAKNEVYARHGYIFKSQELRDYFSQFDWYKGTTTGEKFSESVFNEYEKRNVTLLSDAEHSYTPDGYVLNQAGYDIHAVRAGGPLPLSTVPVSREVIESMKAGNVERLGSAISLDLDQDGEDEEIGLFFDGYEEDYYGNYILQVNGKKEIGFGECLYEDLYGVCLGTGQIYILVCQDGPSDDPVAEFYLWQEGELTKAGEIYVFVNDIITDGNGLISGWQRTGVMDTNFMYGEWEIGADGMLHLGGSGNYEMNRKDYQLKKTIRVYESNSYQSRSRKIDPQSVSVTCTDGGDWVYIEAENGKWGWFEAGALSYEEKNSTFGGMFYAG